MKLSHQESSANSRERILARGVFWNTAFQLPLMAVSFVSMLVLVRVISPAEYGRAAAATGVLAVINCFNCSNFISQAIQLHEGDQPDWGAHWRAGFYIQVLLTMACNIAAGVAWVLPAYRPIAPLLHVASLGLLLDWPNQLSLAMLRREMDFKHIRLIHSVSTLVTAGASITLGATGAGAYALIVGSNVLSGLPFGIYLLALRRWRPPEGNWFAAPNWTSYRSALRFGAQLSGTAVLTAVRGLIEAAILPRTIGYEAIGLLGRAQVLFTTTFGRLNGLIIDTVYPLLPRSAHDPVQFARHATLVAQAMFLFSIPGAVFIALEGPLLSRLIYGATWMAADPLIAPGTVLALGAAASLVFGSILLAANRLRLSFIASFLTACLGFPAMFVALRHENTLAYAWTLAFGQAIATCVGMALVSHILERGWVRQAVLPPAIASGFGGVALLGQNTLQLGWTPGGRLTISLLTYAFVVIPIMRLAFPEPLRAVLARLPGAERWIRWLKL